MPPGKRRQSNAMLYTLITFVALFIIATTVAVIYYVKAEELRTKRAEAQDELNRMASVDEVRRLGEIVGERAPGQSYLATTIDHLDQVVGLVTGRPVQATTAQVKASNTSLAVKPLLARARLHVDLPAPKPAADANDAAEAGPEPNQVALTVVMTRLLDALDETTKQKKNLDELLTGLQRQFDSDTAAWGKAKEELNAKAEEYRQTLEDRMAEYAKLTEQVNQSSKELAQTYDTQLKIEQDRVRQLTDDLLRTQAELNVAQERLKDALADVDKARPAPDRRVAAQKPDGKVILVDEAAGVIHINLGSNDRVYHGLTFSVYDGSSGIPGDGVGKAEVEVFSIDKATSMARVLPPVDHDRAMADLYKTFSDAATIGDIMAVVDAPLEERTTAFEKIAAGSPERLRVLTQLAIARQQRRNRTPIAVNDTVANLIWDKGKANQFIIAGDFDLNADGRTDSEAIEKIRALIEKWGGTVSNTVSSRTDFVILGDEPRLPPQPTLADLANDPTARDRYETAQQRLDRYNQIRQQASSFYIPVFSYERFLYFIGYKVESAQPGAF